MQTIGIEQILALLVALDPALRAPHPLLRYAPQQPLALVAVGRRGGGPGDEIVRCCAADRVDERLESLLVHVHFLLS